MRRRLTLSIAMLFLAALPASAQQILPASFASWHATAGNPGNPAPPAAGAPAMMEAIREEYGQVSQEEVWYAKTDASGNSPTELQVICYRMKDPSGAYGLYSFFRDAGMKPSDLTEHSSISDSHALILVGNLVLAVGDTSHPLQKMDLKSLVTAVQQRAQDGALPVLPLYLPEANRVPVSDTYVLGPRTLEQVFPFKIGNVVGFQRSAEAEVARYRIGGREQVLLIVGFPTDQLAAAQLSELQKYVNVNGAGSSSGAPLYSKRSARLVAIVAGATSQAEANILLDQIQMETERSWNERVPKHEPPIEMMIEGSIVGALTICVFALVAGLSFGGVRLLVKRVAPGKIFDRNNHLQVLQLGLGSKPINSDDFYGYTGPVSPATGVDKNLPDRVALRIFR